MLNLSPMRARIARLLPSPPLAVVWLGHWSYRHAAARWCASQLVRGLRKVRCQADHAAERAVFLFWDETQAVEFKLRFG